MIDVKVLATLREGREKACRLPADVSIADDILKRSDISAEGAAILLLNGFRSKPGDAVKDGDIVSLFSPCAGG